MFSPASSSDFFHFLAKKYLPQPSTIQQGPRMPGMPQSLPMGGTPRYTGTYAQGMQQSGPFQGLNYSSSGGPGTRGDFGSQEARASSGDRYANLTEDPFARGPVGF